MKYSVLVTSSGNVFWNAHQSSKPPTNSIYNYNSYSFWQHWIEDIKLGYSDLHWLGWVHSTSRYPVIHWKAHSTPGQSSLNLSRIMKWCKIPDKAWDSTGENKDSTKHVKDKLWYSDKAQDFCWMEQRSELVAAQASQITQQGTTRALPETCYGVPSYSHNESSHWSALSVQRYSSLFDYCWSAPKQVLTTYWRKKGNWS